ncbi:MULTISPECIES: hypothetical protein [Corynebacterium]|uniref:hypothetical protein n=1 Tax=Corynebacterium TaxID=1716 RepID=UPI0011C84134|nr:MULTISPECIES: hypothetical protein [Corynebacterium]TXS64631.1 hypothetical protein CHU71_04400 [Corynebacterium sp. LK14]HAT1360257.1 hypothetical protein [Corynebacterium striatum]
MDFKSWRKHIDQVVEDEGYWVGLADENGYPLLDIPPFESLTLPRTRLATSEFEFLVHAPAGSPINDDLVADGIGVQDQEGRLIPAKGPTRMLIVVTPGNPRLSYFVNISSLSGISAPDQLTVKGVDGLDCLAFWPGVSIPVEVEKATFSDWSTDASGIQYEKTRRLARVPLATVADGYTLYGKARTVIRRFIQDSFDAVNALMGWTGDEHAVVDFGGGPDTTSEIYLRTSDDYVWDTIAGPAKNSGLYVHVDLWWPGDPAVTVRKDRASGETVSKTWERPMLIVRVDTMKEV